MIDASSLLLLIKSRGSGAAEALAGSNTIPLTRYEVGNALRTSVQVHHEATEEEAEKTLINVLLGISIMNVIEQGDEESMVKILRGSIRHRTTFYDSSYLTAAESLGATLVTEDRSLALAAGKAGVECRDAASLDRR